MSRASKWLFQRRSRGKIKRNEPLCKFVADRGAGWSHFYLMLTWRCVSSQRVTYLFALSSVHAAKTVLFICYFPAEQSKLPASPARWCYLSFFNVSHSSWPNKVAIVTVENVPRVPDVPLVCREKLKHDRTQRRGHKGRVTYILLERSLEKI